MPRPNPFLRRASSPGDINRENISKQQELLSVPPLPVHPAKLTQASLSDSALKVPVRPSTFRNTQSRMMSIRPSRFIKASTPVSSISSPIILNDTSTTTSSEMSSFIRLFDAYTQKIYIEGYLMKHNSDASNVVTPEDQITKNTIALKKSRTKMFAELSGSTLTLWDTGLPGSTIMPAYIQIVDTTIVYSNSSMSENGKKKRHMFTICNKKSTITFETSDDPTVARWVSAIRLSCFEKQKLHQLFTLQLLSNNNKSSNNSAHNLSTTSLSSVEEVSLTSTSSKNGNTKSTFLQVRVPGTSIWQKYWVVLTDRKKEEQKSKRFGKRPSLISSADLNEQQILLYETKKSKTPLWTLSALTHAYAVYPESSQLIEKGSMIRIDCKLKPGKPSSSITSMASSSSEALSSTPVNHDEGYCWFMADHSQLTTQWLLAVYDTFKLYGRPESLLNDSTNQKALNFGEINQDISNTIHPKLFLDTNDIVQAMDVSSISRHQIESIMNSMILKKQADDAFTVTRRPTGTRANSLPLITVISVDENQQQQTNQQNSGTPAAVESVLSLSDVTPKSSSEDQPAPYKFARHIADSSDDSEDEDEDCEEEEEPDSDDEPIGRKNSSVSANSKMYITTSGLSSPIATDSPSNTFADSLIPDFDFGNGFDVPKNVTAAAVAAAVNASNLSQTLPTRGSRQQRNRHSSSMSIFMSDQERQDGEFSLHTRKASMPANVSNKEQQRSQSSAGYYSTSGGSRSAPSPPSNNPSTSLFGDFSLTTDFRKFLDQPLDQRKYSLPVNVKLSSSSFDNQKSSPYPTESRSTTSSSHYYNHNNGSHQHWDNEWEDEYEDEDEQEDVINTNKSCHPYDDDSYDSDFDGPLIPSLGDNFAPQNSLLDTYLGEQLSAKEQIEYAKATGQPLIKVSTKEQGAPRGGLVGMISQREKDRKEGNGLRVAERVNQHHAQLGQDRFEREKERRIFEQRQHQFMKHQMMLYANGYVMPPMPMMHPHSFMPLSPMGPLSTMGPMSPMGTISPMSMAMLQQQQQMQQQFSQSSGSLTPPPLLSLPQQYLQSPLSSAPSSPHTSTYGNNIRPIYGPPPPSSPIGYYQQGRQSPSFSTPISATQQNHQRKLSRPLLDEVNEGRTISPILRKSPVASTSSDNSSSVRL